MLPWTLRVDSRRWTWRRRGRAAVDKMAAHVDGLSPLGNGRAAAGECVWAGWDPRIHGDGWGATGAPHLGGAVCGWGGGGAGCRRLGRSGAASGRASANVVTFAFVVPSFVVAMAGLLLARAGLGAAGGCRRTGESAARTLADAVARAEGKELLDPAGCQPRRRRPPPDQSSVSPGRHRPARLGHWLAGSCATAPPTFRPSPPTTAAPKHGGWSSPANPAPARRSWRWSSSPS